jgi:hypothetical protein
MMLRRFLTVAVTATVLGLSGCGGDEDEPAVEPEATVETEEPAVDSEASLAEEEPVTVELQEQNDSRQSGEATLTAEGEQTRVALDLDNPPAEPQPVHIHEGTCDDLNPTPEFPLENLTDGTSETVVDVPLADLQEGEFAINAHASEQDIETYVACGEIPSSGA